MVFYRFFMKPVYLRTFQVCIAILILASGCYFSYKLSVKHGLSALIHTNLTTHSRYRKPINKINRKMLCGGLLATLILTFVAVLGIELTKVKFEQVFAYAEKFFINKDSVLNARNGNNSLQSILNYEFNNETRTLDVKTMNDIILSNRSVIYNITFFEPQNSTLIPGLLNVEKTNSNKIVSLEDLFNTELNIVPDYTTVPSLSTSTLACFSSEATESEILNKLTYCFEPKLVINNSNKQTLDANNEFPFITELHIFGVPLKNLLFLNKFENLEILEIKFNKLDNLNGIEYCNKLMKFSFDYNLVSDLSFLSKLESLISLSFNYNQVAELNSLENLNNLISLSFDKNFVSSLLPIASLKNLKYLDFRHNPIKDITPLKEYTELLFLNMAKTGIKSLYALAFNKNLVVLDVSDTGIDSISEILEFKNLFELNISNNIIFDLTGIDALKKLQTFFANKCLLRNLSPLIGLDNLNTLSLAQNVLEDISSLRFLPSLTNLDLSSNGKIKNIDTLYSLKNLKKVNLWGIGAPFTDLIKLKSNIGAEVISVVKK